jgi:hypothetical protein
MSIDGDFYYVTCYVRGTLLRSKLAELYHYKSLRHIGHTTRDTSPFGRFKQNLLLLNNQYLTALSRVQAMVFKEGAPLDADEISQLIVVIPPLFSYFIA